MANRTLPKYTNGLISVTNGQRNVVGDTTNWVLDGESQIAAGDVLVVGTQRPVMISEVVDATHFTLVEPWPHGTVTNGAYQIWRFVALPTGAVLAALQEIQAQVDAIETGGGGSTVVVVDNRTTNDATKALSAAEGKRLGDDITAIEADVAALGSGASLIVMKTIPGTAYTLIDTDLTKKLIFTAATEITVTCPSDFPEGWSCLWKQKGDGRIKFVKASTGLVTHVSDHTRSLQPGAQGALCVDSNSNGTSAQFALTGDTTA